MDYVLLAQAPVPSALPGRLEIGMSQLRRGTIVGLACAALGLAAPRAIAERQGDIAECRQVPPNIQVSEMLRPTMEKALASSQTVRRQCAAIAAAPHVRVKVRLAMGRLLDGALAHATISRHEYGALLAEMWIPVCVDQIELLAHELEHVLEQMDGVRLAMLADARAGGVSQRADGSFETARAQAAGRAAALEVEAQEARDGAGGAPPSQRAGKLGRTAAWPRWSR